MTGLTPAGVPTWIVHAEKKGDGGLTDGERETLEACDHTRVVTIPGSSFFLPVEESSPIADVIVQALEQAPSTA